VLAERLFRLIYNLGKVLNSERVLHALREPGSRHGLPFATRRNRQACDHPLCSSYVSFGVVSGQAAFGLSPFLNARVFSSQSKVV
jgi:hypothetical protein